jgi:hypothetical protein
MSAGILSRGGRKRRQANGFKEAPECRRRKLEDRLHEIEAQMVVEKTNTSQFRQSDSGRELSDTGQTVNHNQRHSDITHVSLLEVSDLWLLTRVTGLPQVS